MSDFSRRTKPKECEHPYTTVDRFPPAWSRQPYPAILTETCDGCGATIKTRFVAEPLAVISQ